MLDLSTEFGAHVAGRLDKERIIWLVSVGADLTPQPSPVWFVWDGEQFLIYSRPGAPKLRNIARNPKVALHFDGDGIGGDIVIFTGEARIDESAPPANEVARYVERYREGFTRIQMTPESFALAYSVAIRVRPSKLRGH
ncbi:MAG TPA: TIGR03667 family PPOX class F420-dependent oxidoreductase [Blastocatellia bacterium]|jgi:PPOX class probable F420-dependent enzyme|nr:TIGR03667 family PPOX class F420-dependent oxidoreductase [Blastocatellia bacterium]